MRLVCITLAAALLGVVRPAAAQESFVLRFSGHAYQQPDAVPDSLANGEGYEAVGIVTEMDPMLAPHADFLTTQYTVRLADMNVVSSNWYGPYLVVQFADGGRLRCYGDPIVGGTAATSGVNPPNSTAPSSFIDGTLELGSRLGEAMLVYDFAIDRGGVGGMATFDEGSMLFYVPPAARSGWSFWADLEGASFAPVPTGYMHGMYGSFSPPDLPARGTTWGAVKALYR